MTDKINLKKCLIAVFFAGLLYIPLWFLTTFKTNLHCTQYTSFSIAMFDMNVHPEEAFDPPVIYETPFAVPLRIYFAFNLALFLFYPIIKGIAAVFYRISVRNYAKSLIAIIGFYIINLILCLFFAP